MMEKLEVRVLDSQLSVQDDMMIVEGLVNKTEAWSHYLGQRNKFKEKIEKGAFTRAIQNQPRIDFLGEHKIDMLLATTENGSLELWEDEEGLKMRAQIAPTSYGKDLFTLMKHKMLNHMSFGFKVVKDNWKKVADGTFERSISELMLKEVSVVRNPAYPQSAIAARGIDVVEDVEIPTEVQNEERNEENTVETTPVVEQPIDQNKIFADMLAQFKTDLLTELKQQIVTEQPKTPEVVEQPTQEVVQETVQTITEIKEEKVEQPVVNTVEEVKVEPETTNKETIPSNVGDVQGIADLLEKYKKLQNFK